MVSEKTRYRYTGYNDWLLSIDYFVFDAFGAAIGFYASADGEDRMVTSTTRYTREIMDNMEEI